MRNLFIGGFLLLPEKLAISSPELVIATLQHFHIDPASTHASLFDETASEWLDIPTDQVIKTGYGSVFATFEKHKALTFDFLPSIAGYKAVMVGTQENDMRNYPEETERFINCWVELCVAVKAEYAYFAPFKHMVEDEYLYTVELPNVQKQNATGLFGGGGHWLYYFGPALAASLEDDWCGHLKERNPVYYTHLQCRKLASSALFVRTDKIYL